MSLRRRPNVRRLARKGDAKRLVAALGFRDPVSDSHGRLFDLGAATRRDAALALISVADTADVDVGGALIGSLSDTSAEVRRAAAVALGARRDGRAVEPLAEAALTWDEPRYREARAAATEALVDLSGPECADAFTTLAIEGPFDLNRCHDIVVRLLERGGQDALRAASAAAINALAAARDDRAARAAEVLVWLGPSSVEPLLGLLEQASAPRATTIRALGRLHDLRAIEPVSEFLGDEDPDARRAAATALGEICDPRTASRLMKATSDPDHRVRDAALEALRKLGPLAAATPPSPHPDEAPLSNGNGSHDVRARSPASPPVMPGSAGWLAG